METMNLRYVEISVPTNVELKLNILLNPNYKKHPNKPWQECLGGSGWKHSICTVAFFCIVYWKLTALTTIVLRYITDVYSGKSIF